MVNNYLVGSFLFNVNLYQSDSVKVSKYNIEKNKFDGPGVMIGDGNKQENLVEKLVEKNMAKPASTESNASDEDELAKERKKLELQDEFKIRGEERQNTHKDKEYERARQDKIEDDKKSFRRQWWLKILASVLAVLGLVAGTAWLVRCDLKEDPSTKNKPATTAPDATIPDASPPDAISPSVLPSKP